MPPCFEARSGDGIHAGFLKCCSLLRRCRRTDGDDPFRPALLQGFSGRNSEDEAECWYVSVQYHARLICKSLRRKWLVRWTGRSQGGKIGDERSQAPVEFVFICGSRTFILH